MSKDYAMIAKHFRDLGRWTVVPNWFLKVMSLEEALLLSDLLNLGGLRGDEDQVVDGWFLCSLDTVERRLGLTRRMQERLMGLLESKGFVERAMRGNPARRHVRINTDKVYGSWKDQIVSDVT